MHRPSSFPPSPSSSSSPSSPRGPPGPGFLLIFASCLPASDPLGPPEELAPEELPRASGSASLSAGSGTFFSYREQTRRGISGKAVTKRLHLSIPWVCRAFVRPPKTGTPPRRTHPAPHSLPLSRMPNDPSYLPPFSQAPHCCFECLDQWMPMPWQARTESAFPVMHVRICQDCQ